MTRLNYGDLIPDEEHVVRYCRKNKWKKKNGEGYEIKADAFRSGSDPTADISVNWLGYFGNDEAVSLNKVCETTTYRGINESGVFLKLNTTEIRKIFVESLGRPLATKYRPGCNNKNPSHAEICPSGDAVFKALALHAESHGTVIKVPDDYK